jgi:hypothetical protein
MEQSAKAHEENQAKIRAKVIALETQSKGVTKSARQRYFERAIRIKNTSSLQTRIEQSKVLFPTSSS